MFTHTYMICNMEPEFYDYENDQREDYSEDDWYYQPGMPGGNDIEEDDEDYDDEDDYPEDDEDYLDGDYKDEDNSYHKYNADW